MFEPFRTNPTPNECAAVFHKAESLRREQRRQGRANDIHVWIVSPGEARASLAQMWARLDMEWGEGFFEVPPLWNGHVVIPRFLPRVPETLILRLLGNGKTQREAFEELVAVEASTIREPLVEIFLRWRLIEVGITVDKRDERGKEFIMNSQVLLDNDRARWRAEGHQEGRQEGRQEGHEAGHLLALKQSAMAFYRSRFEGHVSSAAIERIGELGLSDLQALIPKLAKLTQVEIHASLGVA